MSRIVEQEIRVGEKRMIALREGLDFPGNRLFVEIMGPKRGVCGGAYLEKEHARLIANLLMEWAGEEK